MKDSKAVELDREAIEKLLPMRYHMLMLDSAIVADQSIETQYFIHPDSLFMDGHFPGNKVLPGTSTQEVMEQSGALLALFLHKEFVGKQFYLIGADKVRYAAKVLPSHFLRVKVGKVAVIGNGAKRLVKFSALAEVSIHDSEGGIAGWEKAATGDFTGIAKI